MAKPSKDKRKGLSKAATFVEEHRFDRSQRVYGIAELAREFDVTPRALRFYEDKGLLTPGRVSGQRVYSRRDRARMVIIQRAKGIGSTLDEIKEYLDLYGDHGEGRQKQLEFVIARTDDTIVELEEKKKSLVLMLGELRVINSTCKDILAKKKNSLS